MTLSRPLLLRAATAVAIVASFALLWHEVVA